MDLPVTYYNRGEYIETATGNKVYQSAGQEKTICGTQNIVLNGKNVIHKDVIIRGDMCAIRTGKYCIVCEGTIIRPSQRHFNNGPSMFPVHIGEHVMIREDCVISAAQICSYVYIGAGSIIGRSAIIKEGCRVLPGSVIAPDSVFPPFSKIGGNPARVIGQEPECTVDLLTHATKEYYDCFLPSSGTAKPSFSS
ncbi:unnamed protein product [Auanema sp. JU1783]|nr:unnamed protein product [Auanema sp. JU1783]